MRVRLDITWAITSIAAALLTYSFGLKVALAAIGILLAAELVTFVALCFVGGRR